MMSRSGLPIIASLFFSLFGFVSPGSSSAQQPRLISYQGLAKQGGFLLQGSHYVTINYYDAANALIGTEADSAYFTDGVFDFVLGHHFSGHELPPSIFSFTNPIFIGVSIDNGAELGPHSPLLSSPYAINSSMVNGIEASPQPDSGKLFPLPLVGGKVSPTILPNYIMTINHTPPDEFGDYQASVLSSSVGTTELKNGAVTRVKIANGAVGLAQMDSSVIVNPASPTTWTAPQTFQAGATTNNLIVQDGHLIAKQGTFPTFSVSSTAAIPNSGLYNETDMGGKLIFTTSASAGATDYIQINFNKPFVNPPVVVISPVDASTGANFTKFSAASTTTYFRVALGGPIAGTFELYYMVLGTQ